MSASMVFWRELHLPYNLLFRAPANKVQPIIIYVVDLVDWLHDIHHYACQHLKAHYDHLANSVGFQEED
jgi:hypothetical protein